MKPYLIIFLLLVLVNIRGQDQFVSPAYYPIEVELTSEWVPVVEPIEYGSALPTFWQKNKKGLLISAIQISAVVLDGIGDAIYDLGKESGNSSQMTLGHTVQAFAVGGAASATAALTWKGSWVDGIRFGIGYLGYRYALLDLSYNLTKGIDPLYADGLKAKMTPGGRVFTQSLAFVFSFSWNIREF